MKRLKRGEPGKSCVKHEVLTPSRCGIGFLAEEGDYVHVEYDDQAKTVTVRVMRERTK